jgi:hypothetical protein
MNIRTPNPQLPCLKLCLPVPLVACALYSSDSFASSRTKTDIVYMLNGDKITGEIQSLEKGQLSIKPNYACSSFVTDWDKVDHLESSQMFIVADPTGTLYAGELAGGMKEKTLTIVKIRQRDVATRVGYTNQSAWHHHPQANAREY